MVDTQWKICKNPVNFLDSTCGGLDWKYSYGSINGLDTKASLWLLISYARESECLLPAKYETKINDFWIDYFLFRWSLSLLSNKRGVLGSYNVDQFFIHPLLGNPQAGSFFELIFQTRKNVNTLYVSSEKQKLWLVNEGCLQNKPCIVYTDHSFNTLLWKAALVCFNLKCKHSFATSFPLIPKSVCLCVFIFVSLCVCVSLWVCVLVFVRLCLWLNSSVPSWLVSCLQQPASPLWCAWVWQHLKGVPQCVFSAFFSLNTIRFDAKPGRRRSSHPRICKAYHYHTSFQHGDVFSIFYSKMSHDTEPTVFLAGETNLVLQRIINTFIL